MDDLRRSFVDGPFRNVYDRFFELLLTIHPYVQELWTPHWKAAGLDRVCSISGSTAQEHTIYFRPLQAEEMSIPLTLAYMDYFRITSEQRGSLHPFDKESVVEALRLSGKVPGPMLKILRLALERAVREDWETIRTDQVRTIYEDVSPMEPEDEGITEELPPAQVHLAE